MTLAHSIKVAVSMIVSDDTGELLHLIRAITILCGLCINVIQVVLPVLEWINTTAITMQQAWQLVRLWPVGMCGVG